MKWCVQAETVVPAREAASDAARKVAPLMPQAANELAAKNEALWRLEQDLEARQQHLSFAAADLRDRHTQLQQRRALLRHHCRALKRSAEMVLACMH